MNDEQLRDAFERGLPRSDGSPTLDDVSAERLRRLVEGEGSESERLRTLDVALSSAEGRRELEIAWAAARAARPPRRSWQRFTLAASVLIVAGLGASTLWLRGHNATIDGKKGLAPLGRRYVLVNTEYDKTFYDGGFYRFQAGPFLDMGKITDPSGLFGDPRWLVDTGVQMKLRVLGSVSLVLSYGRDLRNGRGAFFGTTVR